MTVFRREWSWLKRLLFLSLATGGGGAWETMTGKILTFIATKAKPVRLSFLLNPIQAGSGDPSPENVRAISGHDGATVYRTGKNVMCGVLNHPVAVYAQGDPDTQCIITNSAGTSLIAVCKSGVMYTISGIADRNRGKVAFFESYPDVNSVGENITVSNTKTDGYSFTATKDGYYACYVMNAVVSTDAAQIEIGATATGYEPYNGASYPATFPSVVYGGEVDWNAGKLKVTHAITSWVGAESEDYIMDTDAQYGWTRFRRAYSDAEQSSGRKNVTCNMGVFSSTANTAGTCFLNVGYIYYYAPNTITSKDDFKTWLQSNNLQFVYPLATPTEVSLSDLDSIVPVVGVNNVWVDNSDRVTVAYFGVNENLLDYSDLVNMNYGGDANAYNVRPQNRIAVNPGSTLVMNCELQVNEFNVRFYDGSGTYQSSKTLSVYGNETLNVTIIVPEDSFYILPKWHKTGDGLPVETLVAANPTIKYT